MVEIFAHIKSISFEFYQIFKIIFRQWHIRKVINVSNLLKLFFIYVFAVLWVIIFEIDYSKNFWTKAVNGNFNSQRFAFYSVAERIGENMLYQRVKLTADKSGYDYSGLKFSESLSSFFLLEHFYTVATSVVNYIFKPKFNLALTHYVNIVPKFGYNVAYLNMPLESFFDAKGNFNSSFDYLKNYDAYADLYSLTNGSNKFLSKMIKRSNRNKPIIPLYFAQNAEEYSPVSMNKALITGSLWGCNRNSTRLSEALKKLADDGLLVGIGLKKYLDFLGDSYLGKMEEFNNALDAIRDKQQEYGISLIIHNQDHMLEGLPTSRISEAASSGALIISDRNVFLTKFFGDTILYFDIFADSNQIYDQIKSHIKWAQDNPKEANAKAYMAYKVFMDNFTLEIQLDKLFKFIENNIFE